MSANPQHLTIAPESPAKIKDPTPFNALCAYLMDYPPLDIDAVWEYSEAGSELGGYGSFEGTFGARVGKEFGLGLSGELSAEAASRRLSRTRPKEGILEFESGIVNKLSNSWSFAGGFKPYAGTGRPSSFDSILGGIGLQAGFLQFNANVEQTVKLVSHDGASYPHEIHLITKTGGATLLFPKIAARLGATGTDEIECLIELDLNQPITTYSEWLSVVSQCPILRQLAGGVWVGNPLDRIHTVVRHDWGRQIQDAILAPGIYSQPANYTLSAELTKRTLATNLGGDLHIVLGIGAEKSGDTGKGRRVIVEEGRLSSNGVFPLYCTGGVAAIPPNATTIDEIEDQWAALANQVIVEGDITESCG